MAKIREYPDDPNVEGDDKVIGSNSSSKKGTKNYTVDDLAEYLRNNLAPGNVDNSVLVQQDGKLVEGFITEMVDSTSARSRVFIDFVLANSIYMTDPSTIVIGENISNVIGHNATRPGARVVLTNVPSDLTIVSKIESVNEFDRTITLTGIFDNWPLFSGVGQEEAFNEIVITSNLGVNIDGAITINGTTVSVENNTFLVNPLVAISPEAYISLRDQGLLDPDVWYAVPNIIEP